MISKIIIQTWPEKRKTYVSPEALIYKTILIYKTTTATATATATTTINSSEFMLEKTLCFIMAQFLKCYQKNCSGNDEPFFCLLPVCCLLFYSQSRFLAGIFFQREIECFIECLVECVNAGIDDQKYILTTVLQENIQKGILQQMININFFQNIFFLFFNIFK